ncbi:MAG TPA: enolase C-terminal domain-like protein [Polyangiaceae bacterium]|nr:enolase C-terminal domain-like protein [Polyangiaceae bacterium]
MNLRDISIDEVSGALAHPVGKPARAQHQRAGLVLRLRDAEGNVGVGEASPLPGFSSDSLESCRAALEKLKVPELAACMSGPGSLIERFVRARGLLPAGSPAATFALETALLDLTCHRERCSPFELLGRPALERMELNAVVDGSSADACDHAFALARQGYSTLKVKLGLRWEQGIATLTRLSRESGFRLRADANRELCAEDLEAALPRLAALELEFLEEPCAPELWPLLPAERPPLALDETLGGTAARDLPALLDASHAAVVVLKPMALGGFAACLALADTARAVGCEVVITHLFDGPIALRAASVLALVVQSPRFAAGLAPHPGLGAWPAALASVDPGPCLHPGIFRAGISTTHVSDDD